MALGQALSQSLPHNGNSGTPVTLSPAPLSKNISRLLSAIVVSTRFRHLLMSDPVAALASGYNGEKFQLTPVEYAAVTSLHVDSASDFAAQLVDILQSGSLDSGHYPAEEQSDIHIHSPWIFNTDINHS